MKKTLLLAALPAVLLPVLAEEIRFDENLTGWTKSFAPGAAFDPAGKDGRAASLRLTGQPNQTSITVSRMLELEPNKIYEVTVTARGEKIADKRTGLFFNAGEKWKCATRWSGTFGRTQSAYILDTGEIGSPRVKLLVTLFGKEGKLWIDSLKIVPVSEVAKPAGKPAAKPADGTIYRNPDFRHSVGKDGKVRLQNHWINGKLSAAGTHEERPAIRLEGVFLKSWNAFVGNAGQSIDSLEPGKYTFSVWCCPEKGVKQFGLFFGRRSGETGKNRSTFRKYMPFEMPKEGEWTELAINFEVKPGDTKLNFFFCFWGEKDKGSTALFADPKIVREEDAE